MGMEDFIYSVCFHIDMSREIRLFYYGTAGFHKKFVLVDFVCMYNEFVCLYGPKKHTG